VLRTGRPAKSARLVRVLKASPNRIEPACPHFGPETEGGIPCGGCSWQHIAYPEQLRLKRARIERLLAAARVPARVQPMQAATPLNAPWGFRQKVHFHVAGGVRPGPPLHLGHYARGSRRVVAVQDCPVHDPRGNAIAFAACRSFKRGKVQAEGDRSRGVLQALSVRVARGSAEAQVTVVAGGESDPTLRSATRAFIGASPEDTSFHLNVHPDDDGFIFGPNTRRLAGPERLRERVLDTDYLVSPTAFFQTNVAAAELLVREVLRHIPIEPSQVLDLYAGAGLFAIPMARAGHTVTAIEDNRRAVADGEVSARLNRVPSQSLRFIVKRTEDALRHVQGIDAAVMDPPREGCAPSVIDAVFGRIRPTTVVYVSCNPEALAQDLRAIVQHGYHVGTVVPIDMFPHSPHIEAVVTLTR
jgi:23S rRNA (uracil1939-C5)-methyltransferase